LRRAQAAGIDARASIAAHDSHGFFGGIGDLIVTGPTLTNVNDVRAILIA
jgi:glycerate 2-kinase